MTEAERKRVADLETRLAAIPQGEYRFDITNDGRPLIVVPRPGFDWACVADMEDAEGPDLYVGELFAAIPTEIRLLVTLVRRQEEELERVRAVVGDVLPMAAWESCQYKQDPIANPTTHCCDWNEIVERARAVLARRRLEAEA